MKKLIEQALKEVMKEVEENTPKNKGVTMSSDDLSNVSLLDIEDFMEANNIPQNAQFDTFYDEWMGQYYPILTWTEIIPTTEEEIYNIKRIKFNKKAWHKISEKMSENRYSFENKLMLSIDCCEKMEVYGLFLHNGIDKIVEMYSTFYYK